MTVCDSACNIVIITKTMETTAIENETEDGLGNVKSAADQRLTTRALKRISHKFHTSKKCLSLKNAKKKKKYKLLSW